MNLQLGDIVPDLVVYFSRAKDYNPPCTTEIGAFAIILPSVSEANARGIHPGGWKTVTPYLRLVLAPAATSPVSAGTMEGA